MHGAAELFIADSSRERQPAFSYAAPRDRREEPICASFLYTSLHAHKRFCRRSPASAATEKPPMVQNGRAAVTSKSASGDCAQQQHGAAFLLSLISSINSAIFPLQKCAARLQNTTPKSGHVRSDVVVTAMPPPKIDDDGRRTTPRFDMP